ncbi:response regulator transcription factor [Hathewaya limosa]|uniref:Stage 0 sporulation protein A homolog n=1 Tax=Hathewaya limosa TaxID=1536 RepID=A0ABU0JWA8_HATLI|nr:response regulator transcription factor [Hathewaya limosa]MDQ0480384.1 DNA-binding response OmpR family regulator [Hathewaya limosa]
MKNILLVEDDMALAIGMEYTLKQENFTVYRASNLKEARQKFKEEKNLNLILLDLTLPDGSGYDFCEQVRKESLLPIIFITACDEEANVVLGLDLGGDDYITKPIRIRELISRINAVLRRKSMLTENTKSNNSDSHNENKINSGDIIVEPLKAKVYKGMEEIILTAGEYKLLLILLENKGNVLSRNVLIERLWDVDGNFVDGNTLNVYIKRLREKIEVNPKESKYIETVRGIGYKWADI